jgi:cation diffusion facilitator CzcD-associated flavoprotein CzcO
MPHPDSATDVAIVGSGPYGLSLAAHLSHRGVEHRIFGPPMRTWRQMFPTMGLKSPDFGTNVYAPSSGYTFVEYCRLRERSLNEPVAISLFAEYGLWAQGQLVPELEQCEVTHVASSAGGFQVTLDTGELLLARRVVMATGLAHWRRMPVVFAGLPPELVSHTSQHTNFARFGGRDVTVIGAGQSALEAATLLHEAGTSVRLLLRGGGAYFAGPPVFPRPLKDQLLYPRSVLGPGRLNLFLEKAPTAVHHLLPEERRVRLTRRHLGPWGAWWLRERFEGNVPVHAGSQIVDARPAASRLRLTVDRPGESGWHVETDHVVCGTGYEVDVDRHPVLDPALKDRVRRVQRAPRLNRHFESSVPGLHFVGTASAFSFGPLFRFVAGAGYTAPALATHLRRTARPAARRSRRPIERPARVDVL